MRTLVARHVQDVAEAARGNHADLGAGALDHHVGGDRRAVEHGVDRAGGDAGQPADLADALEDRFRLVVRRARHLGDDHLLPPGVVRTFQHDVGERPADVDADPDHGRHRGPAVEGVSREGSPNPADGATGGPRA